VCVRASERASEQVTLCINLRVDVLGSVGGLCNCDHNNLMERDHDLLLAKLLDYSRQQVRAN
jgi:hypothetical protein